MEQNKNILVHIDNLEVGYEEKIVLHHVNLTIYEKDFLGIIGPNGGGKTTLIKSIMGLKEIQKGQIEFYKNGTKVNHIGIGYLPQYNQVDKRFPINVEEVVLSGLDTPKNIWKRYTGKQKQQVRETIMKMGLSGLEKRSIGTLSGGQLQRALLARAVVSQPDLLILDEPTAGLDPRERIRIRNLISSISGNKTVIIATHVVSDVEHISREVMLLGRGRLIRKAGTGELTEEISSFVHEITVPAEAIPEVEKQYCVSNILSDGTKARIRILAESVSGRYEASATIPTLEDVYLYHFQLREKGWSDV